MPDAKPFVEVWMHPSPSWQPSHARTHARTLADWGSDSSPLGVEQICRYPWNWRDPLLQRASDTWAHGRARAPHTHTHRHTKHARKRNYNVQSIKRVHAVQRFPLFRAGFKRVPCQESPCGNTGPFPLILCTFLLMVASPLGDPRLTPTLGFRPRLVLPVL